MSSPHFDANDRGHLRWSALQTYCKVAGYSTIVIEKVGQAITALLRATFGECASYVQSTAQSAEPFSEASANMTAKQYFGLECRRYRNSMNSRPGPFTGDFSR